MYNVSRYVYLVSICNHESMIKYIAYIMYQPRQIKVRSFQANFMQIIITSRQQISYFKGCRGVVYNNSVR